MRTKAKREVVAHPEASVAVPIAATSLKSIRESAVRERLDLNKTIAELDALSSEITATLAFLKAHRGDK